jgi:hypothetical protein
VEIKGDVALVGADVSISEGSQLHITLHGEKKYIFYLKAKSNKEVCISRNFVVYETFFIYSFHLGY